MIEVEFRGLKPLDFELGGRFGNVVIQSSNSNVLKGWRVLAIDSQSVGGAASIATALAAGRKRGRFRMTFGGSRQCGGGANVVVQTIQPARRSSDVATKRQPASTKIAAVVDEAPQQAEEERARSAAEEEARGKAAARNEAEDARVAEEEEAAAVGAETRRAEEDTNRAQEEARRAHDEAERRAQAEAERRAQEEVRRAQEDAERKRKEQRAIEHAENERRARQEAEKARQASQQALASPSSIRKFDSLPPRAEVKDPQHTLLLALCSLPCASGAPEPVNKPEDNGPCDKCDGKHATDRCPYFSKARDKHQDAWLHYDKPDNSKDSAEGGVVILRSACVVRQPGDGSCLFHSLAHGIGGSASGLRHELATFAESQSDVAISGTALRDWIQWDCGLSPEDYAKRMRGDGRWGGAIEIAIFCHIKLVSVHVYESYSQGSFKRISVFSAASASSTGKIVNVLYGGRVHYDALEI